MVDFFAGDCVEELEECRVCRWCRMCRRGGKELFVADGGDKCNDFNAVDERQVLLGDGTGSYTSYSLTGRTSTSSTTGPYPVFLLICVIYSCASEKLLQNLKTIGKTNLRGLGAGIQP